MNFKYLVIIFIIALINTNISAKILIKYKVGDQIITNVDIEKEKKYLTFIRPNLKKLSNEDLIKISENSLIREIIKKKELDKILKEFEFADYEEQLKKNLFSYKNVKSEEEFKQLLKKNNLSYSEVLDKVKNEELWNELVFNKFNSLLKINENNLRKDLQIKISTIKKFEYNLSEILFEIDKNIELDDKYLDILENVKKNSFKVAATKFSISNSSINGGEIGWVKETLLSNELNNIIKNMKIDEITKPIKYPNGYLILKLNDKKEIKQKIDFERELKELIAFEKNKQLNQFSLLYYKKLKQNTVINEY